MPNLNAQLSKKPASEYLPLICFAVFVIASVFSNYMSRSYDSTYDLIGSLGYFAAICAAIGTLAFSLTAYAKSSNEHRRTKFTAINIVLVVIILTIGPFLFGLYGA